MLDEPLFLEEGMTVRDILGQASFRTSRPVLFLIGWADNLPVEISSDLEAAFRHAVGPIVEEYGVTVVDGGTASGVMAIAGRALRDVRPAGELIGVAPVGCVSLSDSNVSPSDSDSTPLGSEGRKLALLDRNHRVLLVRGAMEWGDERPAMLELVERISAGSPIVVLLAGGGDIAAKELDHVRRRGWPIISLGGAGGVAGDFRLSHPGKDRPGTQWQTTTVGIGGRRHLAELSTKNGSSVGSQRPKASAPLGY